MCELCVCVFLCRDELYYRAVHGTAVLFLQNDAGFAKWAPTPERLAELLAAYRPSQPASLSSPGPAPNTPGEKDSTPKTAERTQSGVISPVSHDDNNNTNSNTTPPTNTNNSCSSSSSSSPQEKMAAV